MNRPKEDSRDRIGFLRAVGRYYRDPTASVLGKLVGLVAVLYVVVPVDLIPDIPFVGWLDDLGVVGLATAWLTRRVRPYRALGAETKASEAMPPPKPFSSLP